MEVAIGFFNKNEMYKNGFLLALIFLASCKDNKNDTFYLNSNNIQEVTKPQIPIMGWSNWNNFRVHINEDIIKAQADYMVSSGIAAAGYSYVNVDGGFFAGRDNEGNGLSILDWTLRCEI